MAGNKAKSRRSGTSSPPVTPAREANLLRRAMAIAHMGYWQSDSIDSRTFWISPELSEMYGLAAEDGIIAIAWWRFGSNFSPAGSSAAMEVC